MPRMTKVTLLAVSAAALTATAKFVPVDMTVRKPVQVKAETVKGKEPSLLPPGKRWKLVWNDEFDGKEIDRTKWMCRESFWGRDFPAFAHDFEGVEMTGESVKLNLVRHGDDFTSPHLQTGSLTYDIPKDTKGFWPFGKVRRPLFMKKYGYFEIRCRQPKHPGWHSAFWLQSPSVGAHPDPAVCGVETDIMENYSQYVDGCIVGGNGWNGYGKDSKWFGHFKWNHEETADGWHRYGCDWSPDGYVFYCDGKIVGMQNAPVSHVPEFILVSTEPGGYRKVGSDGGLTAGRKTETWGKPDPRLFDVKLPDFFEIDYVRVYDDEAGYAPRRSLEEMVDAGFSKRWAVSFSPKTSLLYGCAVDKVKKAATFRNGLYDWYKGSPEGYGAGIGDCALNHGVALSGCVDRWEALSARGLKPDAPEMRETADWAAKLAQGLLNLSCRHGYTGFVARGLCEEDGKSICSLSSIDQHTHWVHGLWRYSRSSLARKEIVDEFRVRVREVAERMERTVKPENDYNFGLCDGRLDPRGICRMWWPEKPNPTGSTRLASIYAAAYELTQDGHWKDMYETIADEACRQVTFFDEVRTSDPRFAGRTPAYTLLQMNSSLEVLLGIEKEPTRVANLKKGLAMSGAEADRRAKKWQAGLTKGCYGMCAQGELALAQLMAEAPDFDAIDLAFLVSSVRAIPAGSIWGTFQATHYFAAYWRAARLGIIRPGDGLVNPER